MAEATTELPGSDPGTQQGSARHGLDVPHPDDIASCVHCGFCLDACPTYRELKQEADSPRGRIVLIKGLQEGWLHPDADTVLHLERCLVCRACETACPSGVPFGRLMESQRAQLWGQGQLPQNKRRLQQLAFRHILPHPGRVWALARVAQLGERLGLRAVGRHLPGLGRLSALAPSLRRPFYRPRPDQSLAPGAPLPASRAPGPRVALLSGCIMRTAFGPVDQATVDVLEALGCSVWVPEDQTCCGALNVHGGEREAAREMARRNVQAFDREGVDFLVVNSAGCGSTLKEYAALLAGDPLEERALSLSRRVRDFSELVSSLPYQGAFRSLPWRVTYQDACHLAHGQGIRKQPRELLRSIPGLTLVEMAAADRCCGSAGIYNLLQPDLADAAMRAKVGDVAATTAEVMVSGNPGCMLQLAAGLRAAGSPMRVMHLAEVLAEALKRS